jgi:cytochrome b561
MKADVQYAWDFKTRLLHWAIAVTVSFQQFSSIWMSDPGTQYLFPYHRIIGAVTSAVLLLFWLYSYAIYDFKILFPWGKESRREVKQELFALFHLHLPASGHRIGLSSFTHGIGVLALTGCAVTGVVMFSMIPPGHIGPPEDPVAFTRYTLQHKFFGEVLWIYWVGHVAFAVAHQIAGDNVFAAIFGFDDRKDE